MNVNNDVVPPFINLFNVPTEPCGVHNIQWIDHRPLAQIGLNTPIDFDISGAGSAYIDLSRSYLHVRARVTKSGKPLEGGDQFVAPVNLWMHSLFSQCDITLQHQNVSSSGRLYPYKSYIETILKSTQNDMPRLQAEMYYRDTYMEGAHGVNKQDPTKINVGYVQRNKRVNSGQWCEMYGPLHHDLCQLDRLLPCGVDIRIKLTPSTPAFHLRSDAAYSAVYNVEFESVIFKACKVTLDPTIFMAHATVLSKGITAKYPVKKTEINTYVLQQGIAAWTQSDLFQNRVPSKMIIGLVLSEAFNGSFKHNGYNMQGFDLDTITLTLDGQIAPFKPLKTNFKTGECVEAYRNMYNSNGHQHVITLDDFINGNALFVYELDNQMYNRVCTPKTRSGNTSVELFFNESLKANVNVIVYAQFDTLMEIDQYRTIKI